MRTRFHNYIKNLLLPCLSFSITAGCLSAILVTAFKLAAEGIINLSALIYDSVRANPIWIPILILGVAAIGLISSFVLSLSRSCRGGGTPTSVAAIRGILSFKWLAGILVLPFSALLTFISGIPLGTEGPCVQMGTAIGDGVVTCFPFKKYKVWRRYIMTGGASAGFSVVTSSPITAIIFSMEELHKHFSPLLLTVASISVISAQITTQILSLFGIGSVSLFNIPQVASIAPNLLFAPLLIGFICGVGSIFFSRLYRLFDKWIHTILKKVSIKIVFPILFVLVCIVGFFLSDALGTGHSLTEKLISTSTVWYMLILIFVVRAVIMMVSNITGVTGGLFLPTIALGAIIGSFCAEVMIALGWVGAESYVMMVVLGITAFLGATSRIPITACIFAIESLGGINNILPIIIATIVATLVVEVSGIEDITDSIIETRVRSINKDKKMSVIETRLTVNKDSFAVGKELHDILWPDSCSVVSFKHVKNNHNNSVIEEGDIITVRYETYSPADTAEELKKFVGDQSEQTESVMNPIL